MKISFLIVFMIILSILLLSCVSPLINPSHETVSNNGMVTVPKGWFLMGSDDGEFNEKPEHEVYVDTFMIDRYEVSSRDFAGFLNAGGNPDNRYFTHDEYSTVIGISSANGKEMETTKISRRFVPRKGFENYPANNVSWYGAYEYCKWKGKRLPTEAEWEKAAKGNDVREYPWGDESPDGLKARFSQRWDENHFRVMVPVDTLPEGSSPYGLHNMSGNVWEWISDWYRQNYCDFCDPDGSDYDDIAAEISGISKAKNIGTPYLPPKYHVKGPSAGSFKVLRGGSWMDSSHGSLRTAHRYWLMPLDRLSSTGFRCAK